MKVKVFVVLLLVSTIGAIEPQDEETDKDLIDEFYKNPEGVPDEEENTEAVQGVSKEESSNEAFSPAVEAPVNSESQESIELLPKQNESSDQCSCVNYFLCKVDKGGVIDNGEGVIDIRLGKGGSNQGSPCNHYLEICCKQMKDTLPTEAPIPRNHSVCGKRNVGGVGFRITGAQDGEAQFGEFPWMAAIVRQEKQEDKPPLNIFLCGGSLIHPKVVLTAAHCVHGKKKSELKVRLGEWDTQTPDELYPHQDKYVTTIIQNENYYSGALYNDVALLILDEEVKIAPNVDTICLPPPNINFDGQRCFASGWGKDQYGIEGKYQVILKRVGVPVVPHDTCQSSLRQTRLGPYFKLHDSFVCAGGEEGRDTCRGDGGSPLVCKLPNSNYYAQFGIVAWGIGCGEKGTPGVYVNVPKFVPWIEEQLKKLNLDTKYYKSS